MHPSSAPYDLAIVGAGLCGCELAARLAATHRTVLVSQALDHLGNLYGPTVSAEQFPPQSFFAQMATRCTADGGTTESWAFHRALKEELERTEGLHLLQSTVTDIEPQIEPQQAAQIGPQEEPANQLYKLHTWEGPPIYAKTVVLAVGAFLQARLSIGQIEEEAGRLSEVAYDFLADHLQQRGFVLVEAAQSAQAEADTPAYQVRFLHFDPSEQRGYALKRMPHVYALGRCTAGEKTYRSVLQEAQELAALLASMAQR